MFAFNAPNTALLACAPAFVGDGTRLGRTITLTVARRTVAPAPPAVPKPPPTDVPSWNITLLHTEYCWHEHTAGNTVCRRLYARTRGKEANSSSCVALFMVRGIPASQRILTAHPHLAYSNNAGEKRCNTYMARSIEQQAYRGRSRLSGLPARTFSLPLFHTRTPYAFIIPRAMGAQTTHCLRFRVADVARDVCLHRGILPHYLLPLLNATRLCWQFASLCLFRRFFPLRAPTPLTMLVRYGTLFITRA